MGSVYQKELSHTSRGLIIHMTPVGVGCDYVLSFMGSICQMGLSHTGTGLDIHKATVGVGCDQFLSFGFMINALFLISSLSQEL